jgi:VIT1/CCC1 family predicted Fe2+/Mn2+ transporter
MNVSDAQSGWREEMQSAWLYDVLAAKEPHKVRAALFATLAREARDQAIHWQSRLVDEGGSVPEFAPSARARVVAVLVRFLGVRPLKQVLAGMKIRGLSAYGAAAPSGHVMPTAVEEVGLSHQNLAGGNLRAAVFGANDGLVSNSSLVFGMAGATGDAGLLLTAGVAGLLAGALSMAAGEYVSVRSQRELYEHQIDLERKELAEYPDEEAEELALIYEARGMQLEDARGVARQMLSNPDHALDVLAREELGLDPSQLGSAIAAALFSFAAFSIGAIVPLLPFLTGWGGLTSTIVLTALALFGIGVVISLFTGRHALAGGLRMLVIGGSAGGLTYLLGSLVGVSLG